MAHMYPYPFGTEFLRSRLQPLCFGLVGDKREQVFRGRLAMIIIVGGDDMRLLCVMCMAWPSVCRCIGLRWRWCGVDVEAPHMGSCWFAEPL